MRYILFLALLSGCALIPDRYLTPEEDAEMRAVCEHAGGCVLVPGPQWELIKRALGLSDS